jgi:hypothetical protein
MHGDQAKHRWRIGPARAITLAMLASLTMLVAAGGARAQTFTVTNTGDAGPGSLREAIEKANTTGGAPHVVDATGVSGTIALTTALPALTTDVSILGSGAQRLTVRRDSALPFRIFTITGAKKVTLADLTISNGFASTENGGGVANVGGTLTILRSSIIDNTAEAGGGVFISETSAGATIERSTIARNTATYTSGGGPGGGGIYNLSALTLTNSTVSGNTTGGARGAGIVTGGTKLTAISNSTFADNGGSANVYAGSSGNPTMSVRSTIVADFRTAEEGNCQRGGNSKIDSAGFNLSDDASCSFKLPTDQMNTDPKLGPLGDNSGPTPTQALLEGSPAIDRGIADATTVDQRGLARPFDFAAVANAPDSDGSDVGAFELHPAPPPPADTSVTLLIRGKTLLLTRSGKVRVRVTCPATEQSPPCKGNLTLRTRGKVSFGGRQRTVVLATARFSIAAGKTKRLTLTPSPGKAELVRTDPNARRLLAIARVRDNAGNRAEIRQRKHLALSPQR